MKNAYLPKISILLPFWGETLALLCPDDSIQILLILSQFLTLGTETIQILLILSQFLMLGTETKLEGLVWSHRGITELISRPQNGNKMLIFGK